MKASSKQSNVAKPSSVSVGLGAGLLLQRKCACGAPTASLTEECAECAGTKGIQTKLAIGASNDPLEREADRVADRVANGPTGLTTARAPLRVQRSAQQASAARGNAPASVDRVLASPGARLAPALRQDMERSFGHDFSQVRVHADAAAAQSARDVRAHAYTAGSHIVFGASQFAPATSAGRHLLAHELTHVLQQSAHTASSGMGGNATIMRKGFESTVEICHRVLETRKFEVQNGGLRVVIAANSPDKSVPNCNDFNFGVSLNRSEDWWPDKEVGTCEASTGGTRVFTFGNLPAGTYYLTIWRTFDNPNCCLEGDIMVFDEAAANDSEGCHRAKDLSTMDIVHGALDLAGFIPVLGAIPDGINAGIYVVEGDWANAGLSAVAMVPAWGDGVKLVSMAGKSTIRVTAKAAIKLGPKGIAEGLKEVKAVSKAAKLTEEAGKAAKVEKEVAQQVGKEAAEKLEKEAAQKLEKEAAEKAAQESADKAAKEAADKTAKDAAEKAAKEAAEKALKAKIAECLAIHAIYKALGNCSKCRSTDTLAERALKIACIVAMIAGRQSYLNKDCDDVLPGSIARGSAVAKRGHQQQLAQFVKMLADCQSLPTT